MTFDLARTLLVLVVLVLTGLLLLVGSQVFLILRELRQAVRRINQRLEQENKSLGFFQGLRQVQQIFEEEAGDGGEQDYPHIRSLQERGRRFFHRDGKPLSS